ncbi:MAG: hypothetical protein N3E47_04415 [Candidatus Bathyarchaeota archaeon]|nr:hypothetical protein [Candidatus Bathyarchaeota archaeon]
MYDELFEAWRRERENAGLQSLPKDFYVRLADYVRRIREERRMMDEESVRGRLLQIEEENVKRMIYDLIRMRYDKILHMAAGGEVVPLSALTEEEEGVYSSLSICVEAYKRLLDDVMQGRRPRKANFRETGGFIVVRIIKEIPQIVGVDMKIYGPFKPEDIATLPEENAKALIKQGAAMEINVQ